MKSSKKNPFVFVLCVLVSGVALFQTGCQNGSLSFAGKNKEQRSQLSSAGGWKPTDSQMASSERVVYKSQNFDEFDFSETLPAKEEATASDVRKAPRRPEGFDSASNAGLMGDISAGSSSYTVKAGDTLYKIARANGVSLNDLLAVNSNLNKNSLLKIGQSLTLPSKIAGSNAVKAAVATTGGTYTIQRGDTLSAIAKRFGVTVEDIKSANALATASIYAGKKLTLPGVAQSKIDSAPVTKSVQSSANRSVASTATKGSGDYQVQPGDSLSVIASKFGVTVADLMRWNNISDARKLRAGQWIALKEGPVSSVAQNKAVASTGALKSAPVPVNKSENQVRLSNFESMLPAVDSQAAAPVAQGEAAAPVAITTAATNAQPSTQGAAADEYDPFSDDSLFDSSEETPVVTTK